MTLHLTPQLLNHLNILPLQLKSQTVQSLPTVEVEKVAVAVTEQAAEPQTIEAPPSMPKPELEKNEFRLLVKILQAIGHECVFDQIEHKNNQVIYHHPSKDLVFADITINDTQQTMHLSSLQDMNQQPALKRAVWEKLKTL